LIHTVGAAAIIAYGNRYIFEIQKRHKWHFSLKNELKIGIGCIGGSIEPGETPLEALKRESLEEIRTYLTITGWTEPFAIDSSLKVTDLKTAEEKDLFFEWRGTRKPYTKNRVCVFLGEITEKPVPGDVSGILLTDIASLVHCIENDLSFEQSVQRGIKIIPKEKIPPEAKIEAAGTVHRLVELYKNHRARLKNIL